MSKKLSKSQLEVLKALSEYDEWGDSIILHFMEGLNSYWFISCMFKGKSLPVINFLTVEALEKAGLIERIDSGYNKTTARITDKGRELVEAENVL